MKRLVLVLCAGVAVVAGSDSLFAHHSFGATYD